MEDAWRQRLIRDSEQVEALTSVRTQLPYSPPLPPPPFLLWMIPPFLHASSLTSPLWAPKTGTSTIHCRSARMGSSPARHSTSTTPYTFPSICASLCNHRAAPTPLLPRQLTRLHASPADRSRFARGAQPRRGAYPCPTPAPPCQRAHHAVSASLDL